MVISMRRQLRSRWLVGAVLMVGALGMPGCGTPRGTVTGKVTMGGKPVPLAMVTFHGKDSKGKDIQSNAQTGLDGSYHVTGVLAGEMTITVESVNPPTNVAVPPPKGLDIKAGDPVPPAAIPKKYLVVTTSPLKYTVKAGSQDYPIDLTP
jgi:hypothetical protein